MQYVTLVNRTSKTLNGTWDGRQYKITPGRHEFPEIQAMKFKEQNPIMGTEDPYTLQKESLIGIVEQGDNIDPIEQSDKVELLDRHMLPADAHEVTTIKSNGLYNPRKDQGGLPAFDSGFVNP